MRFAARWTRSFPVRSIGVIAPFAALALAFLFVPISSVPFTPAVRNITIRAEQFEFVPGRIEVNQGDHVVITLTSSDVVHGFKLDEFGIDRPIVPGIAEKVEFVADKTGLFHFRCSVVCGVLHPFMTGELVVEPNVPYWRAMGFIVTALAGLLVYLWQAGRSGESLMGH
jgi:heme/copper-type cytochrome/quinol oxidase subunit 2